MYTLKEYRKQMDKHQGNKLVRLVLLANGAKPINEFPYYRKLTEDELKGIESIVSW